MNKKIGELIKKYREQANLMSKELADKIGVSQGTISNIENGKMGRRESSLLIVRKIIELLEIPIDNDIRHYLDIASVQQEHTHSLSDEDSKKGLVKVGSINGYITEAIIQVQTTIREDFNLDELDNEQLEEVKIIYVIENQIMKKTISDYINDNRDEIMNLILKNVEKYNKIFTGSYKQEKI